MAKSLEKTRKKIAKKKGIGKVNALHENSRDSQRLRRAGLRDDKLVRIAAARRRNDQPLLERVSYFQSAIRDNGQPLSLDAIQALIKTFFVHQHDDEYNCVKGERRSGRPASTREDLLRMKIAADEKEEDNGFYLPDLMDADNVVLLQRWEGAWSYLSTLKWVRIARDGRIQPSQFPPKGQTS